MLNQEMFISSDFRPQSAFKITCPVVLVVCYGFCHRLEFDESVQLGESNPLQPKGGWGLRQNQKTGMLFVRSVLLSGLMRNIRRESQRASISNFRAHVWILSKKNVWILRKEKWTNPRRGNVGEWKSLQVMKRRDMHLKSTTRFVEQGLFSFIQLVLFWFQTAVDT